MRCRHSVHAVVRCVCVGARAGVLKRKAYSDYIESFLEKKYKSGTNTSQYLAPPAARISIIGFIFIIIPSGLLKTYVKVLVELRKSYTKSFILVLQLYL
eukprot:COSAG05_NODE_6720_length_914_cov_1.487117_2_plen_99_part_00